MLLNFIFDFAGTLADLKPLSEEMLYNFLKENYDLDIDIQKIQRAYECVDRNIFYSSVNVRSYEDKKDFYKFYNDIVLSNLALSHIVDNSKNQIFEYFISIKRHWVLKKDVKDTFKRLKDKNKNISIVSNFDSKLKDILQNLQIDEFIDNLHISQDEGFEKPDVRFYEIFLKKYNINPKDSLYIGDSYELDFQPALKAGLEPLLLDERGRFEKNSYIIENISDVLRYV